MSRVAWNKGLTKHTDERVAKYSKSKLGQVRTIEQRNNISIGTKLAMNNDKVKAKIIENNHNRIYTQEQRNKRSKIARKLWENLDYANKCSNPTYGNKPTYKNIKFQSNIEMLYAMKLDELNIEYKYHPKSFKYINSKDNKLHNYFPDFYIPKYDLYLEIKYNKNYLYNQDLLVKDKLNGMKALNLSYIVLDKNDLNNLELIFADIGQRLV